MRIVVRPRRGEAPGKPPLDEFERAVSEFFMRLAVREAKKGAGRTSPNPVVGALLTRNGRVIARGHHARAGGPHAEVVALEAAGERAQGADLYTTLEPCDHTGKTPPCSRAILRAGVRRVFVGSSDPNPLVAGRGVRRLRRAGVPVITGILEEACDALNEGWFRYIERGRPFVIAKAAATLDGRIATRTGASRWITSEESRALVHELRDRVDAVIVGRGTVEADDPSLTARLPGGRGRDPVRVILDSKLSLRPTARVLRQRSDARTIVACVAPPPAAARRRLEAAGAEVLPCRGRRGRVDIDDLLARLARRGIVEVLVEGGAEVFSAFLEAGRVDRLLLFLGGKVFGDGPSWASLGGVAAVEDAPAFRVDRVRLVGGDVLIEAVPRAAAARVRTAARSGRPGRRSRASKRRDG